MRKMKKINGYHALLEVERRAVEMLKEESV